MTEIIYEGGPTGRAPTRYEVETLEPSPWRQSDALDWMFNDSFATSQQAINCAKDLQKRGKRVRVVPVRPKTADELIEEARAKRAERVAGYYRTHAKHGLIILMVAVGVVIAIVSSAITASIS